MTEAVPNYAGKARVGTRSNCFGVALTAVGGDGSQQAILSRRLHDHAATSSAKQFRSFLEHQML